VMRNIQEEAIILDMLYTKMPTEPVTDRTPIFRNINISNVTGSDVLIPIKIRGLEESPISNITLTNINIDGKQKCVFQNCMNIKMKDVYVNGEKIEPTTTK